MSGSVSAFGSSRHLYVTTCLARLAVRRPSLPRTLCTLCCAALLRLLSRLRRDGTGRLATAHAVPALFAPRLALPDAGAGRPAQMPLWACYTSAPPMGSPARVLIGVVAAAFGAFAGLAGDGRPCGLTGRQVYETGKPHIPLTLLLSAVWAAMMQRASSA